MQPSRIARLALALAPVLSTGVARADHARRPDGYDDRYDFRNPPPVEGDSEPRSTVRFFTGPVMRFSKDPARGGLGLALDVGARAAGVRLSGAWVRTGSDQGFSEYAAELWVDLAEREPFHPILAAGGAVVRLDRERAGGHLGSDTIGAALLRAGLQYRLPLAAVDARAALDVSGGVPAVGARAADASPWVTAEVTVGVGF